MKSVEQDGKVQDRNFPEKYRYTFQGNNFRFDLGDGYILTGSYRVDSSKRPRRLTFKAIGRHESGFIYEVRGDRLRIATPKGRGGWATGFNTRNKSAWKVFVFERAAR